MATTFHCGRCQEYLRLGFTLLPIREAMVRCTSCSTENHLPFTACFVSWCIWSLWMGTLVLAILLLPLALTGNMYPVLEEQPVQVSGAVGAAVGFALLTSVLSLMTLAPLGALLAVRATERGTNYFLLHSTPGLVLTVTAGVLLAANLVGLLMLTGARGQGAQWVCEHTGATLTYRPRDKYDPLQIKGSAPDGSGPYRWRPTGPEVRLSAAKPWLWLALLVDTPPNPNQLAIRATRLK